MRPMRAWGWMSAVLLAAGGTGMASGAEGFAVQSFGRTGRLTYSTLNDGTNHNYRVEWAPSPSGPWSSFGSASAFWLDSRPQSSGGVVTNAVPMCYRVVATLGDYMAINLSGGATAASYPVAYYRTLADVPGGPNSDTYKTASLLMRLIPKGSFTMGSPSDEQGRYDSETQHLVTLTEDFYIGVFEVTQRQWELVMGNMPGYFTNATYYATRPVEQVSYYDIRENPANSDDSAVDWPNNSAVNAASFMGKLRTKTGLATFDLPTESQWEYACRAGTAAALNSGKNLTSLGADANMAEVGRYWSNGGSGGLSQNCATSAGTATVGSSLPNPWGLYDMHGNVWEWCLDRYGTYSGTVCDPAGAASGANRVWRGGGWNSLPRSCRSAYRVSYSPDNRDFFVGFRVARTLP